MNMSDATKLRLIAGFEKQVANHNESASKGLGGKILMCQECSGFSVADFTWLTETLTNYGYRWELRAKCGVCKDNG